MKTIVQIGVADANDHVNQLISSLNYDDVLGIFIEPNIHSIPHIKNRYINLKNKIISNIAISNKTGFIKIYFNNYISGNSQQASCNKEHLFAHNWKEDDIKEVDVLCFTLNDYLNSVLGFDETVIIDNLFIDTEGHDCDILLSTDFSKLNIQTIYFEITHSDGAFSGKGTKKLNDCVSYLEKCGYKYYEEIGGKLGGDYIFKK